MADFVETVVINEHEIEKLYDLRKFNQFICLCNLYQTDNFEYDSCDNCSFIINLVNIYFKYYLDNLNGIESLQNFCRKHHRNFFSLTSLLKILAAMEKEKVMLELQSKEILEI